jgi:hypothetical protein
MVNVGQLCLTPGTTCRRVNLKLRQTSNLDNPFFTRGCLDKNKIKIFLQKITLKHGSCRYVHAE